ncbi:MAG TPA: alpha-L-fucosidase [Phycisphaerae bacterium]|jgi:alpha-L-fucosidase|nr:alpha-L-fucosidase [Phycisphaerae bacterium]
MISSYTARLLLGAACLTLSSAAGWAQTSPNPTIASGGNSGNGPGADMSPNINPQTVIDAVAAIPTPIPDGPFKPTWDSIQQNYRVPQWFQEARFGIFMHWGLYSVPAYRGGGASEWYLTHLYSGGATLQWHTQKYGPLDKFGYKDFIPLFTADKYDPDAWALLFKKAGAKFVIPTAQHHDNFSLWDSKANPWNAKAMGPKRDLIGDMAKAVRAQGLKFGVSNHGIEAYEFVKPNAQVQALLKAAQADIYDPAWKDYYIAADRNPESAKRFLVNWVARNVELIDQYQVDMLWFDNGVDQRFLDPLKLWIAAYYYNRAAEWKKEVSISTKKAAYAPSGDNIKTIGSIIDFEKIGARSPAGIRTGAWQVDDPIGSNWGYAEGMTVSSAQALIGRLVNVVSQNGTYLLNISPKSDGTIPENQQQSLLGLGEWLGVNGEAIYGTHNWTQFQDAATGARNAPNIRYTVKGDALYAIYVGAYPQTITLTALATGKAPEGAVQSVTMLGNTGNLPFTQDTSGLHITPPAAPPCKYAYALKITGLKMNADTATRDGNPIVP